MEPNNVDTSLTYLSTVLNFIRDLVKASVWPAVLIYALWSFKDDISKLVTRFRGLSARIAGAYVNLSISETVNALNDILAEVDRAARSFSDKEWDLFNAVVAAPAQTPRIVDDLSSDVLKGPFVRNGEIHEVFRNVRNAGLIEPKEHGKWDGKKHAVLTTLGRLYRDKREKQPPGGDRSTAGGTPQSVAATRGRDRKTGIARKEAPKSEMDIGGTLPSSSGSESGEGATPIQGAPSAALDLIVT